MASGLWTLVWSGAGLLLLVGLLGPMAEAVYVRRIAGALERMPAPPGTGLPRVSVVVAARNEARRFVDAACSLLAQDYPDIEVVLVDDRSTDDTGRMVDEVAARDPRVQAVHVQRLPEGWLGKNHALAAGASRATGQWLLFADGDVWLHPTAIRRAVAFAAGRGLDHLTLGPAMIAESYWLQSWVTVTLMMVMTLLSPRRMNRPGARGGFAIGAFNLVRRTAYEAVGTHRAIALRPDDDVRLGMRLRRHGFRQWSAAEPGLVRVEWYPTVAEAVRGLEKNAFAVLNYRPAALAAATAGSLLMFLGPIFGAALLRGAAAWVFRADAILEAATLWMYAATFVVPGRPWRAALVACAYPAAGVVYTYAMARSAWMALTRGGILWRGTFYPLAELRRHTGLEPLPEGPAVADAAPVAPRRGTGWRARREFPSETPQEPPPHRQETVRQAVPQRTPRRGAP